MQPVGSNDSSWAASDEVSTILGLAYTLMSIAGSFLNCFLIIAVVRRSDFQKEPIAPSVVSLAVTDLLFSILQFQNAMVCFTRDMTMYNHCEVNCYFGNVLVLCSVLHLVGISVIRNIVMTSPNGSDNYTFVSIYNLVPMSSWIIAAFYFLPTLIGKYGQIGLECKTFRCFIVDNDLQEKPMAFGPQKGLFWNIGVIGIFAFIMNITTYFQVSRKCKKMHKQIKSLNQDAGIKILEKERKVRKLVAIITASFFCGYWPLGLLMELYPVAPITMPIAFNVVWFVFISIVLVDPLVYMIFKKKYREEIKMLLWPIYEFFVRKRTA